MTDGARQSDPWELLRLAQLATRQLGRALDRLMVRHEDEERGYRDRRSTAPARLGDLLPEELGGRRDVPLEALAAAGRAAAALRDQLAEAYRAARDGGSRG